MQHTNSLFFHYLLEYNTIFKENDVIYRRMAAQFGLSDSAFWILYCLRESATPLTQKQLCESIYMMQADHQFCFKIPGTERFYHADHRKRPQEQIPGPD